MLQYASTIWAPTIENIQYHVETLYEEQQTYDIKNKNVF